MKITTSRDGERTGEWTVEELRTALRQRVVKTTDFAWMPGWTSWRLLSDVATELGVADLYADQASQGQAASTQPASSPREPDAAPAKGIEPAKKAGSWPLALLVLGVVVVGVAGYRGALNRFIPTMSGSEDRAVIEPTMEALLAHLRSVSGKKLTLYRRGEHRGHHLVVMDGRLTFCDGAESKGGYCSGGREVEHGTVPMDGMDENQDGACVYGSLALDRDLVFVRGVCVAKRARVIYDKHPGEDPMAGSPLDSVIVGQLYAFQAIGSLANVSEKVLYYVFTP